MNLLGDLSTYCPKHGFYGGAVCKYHGFNGGPGSHCSMCNSMIGCPACITDPITADEREEMRDVSSDRSRTIRWRNALDEPPSYPSDPVVAMSCDGEVWIGEVDADENGWWVSDWPSNEKVCWWFPLEEIAFPSPTK